MASFEQQGAINYYRCPPLSLSLSLSLCVCVYLYLLSGSRGSLHRVKRITIRRKSKVSGFRAPACEQSRDAYTM